MELSKVYYSAEIADARAKDEENDPDLSLRTATPIYWFKLPQDVHALIESDIFFIKILLFSRFT